MIKKFAKLNLCILSLIVFNNSIAQITSGNAFLPAIQTGQLQAADVMCVSENGKVLLTTSSVGDETLIWNLRSGKLLKKIRSSGCKFLSVSESGGIAVLGSVASIKWFDLYTCEMLGEVIARGVITDVAINAKGTQVAIGIYDQGVHIIDLKKRLIIKKLLDTTAALGTISGVKFLKNDSLLAYSFFNGQINIYNTQNWILNNQYNFNGLVKNMAFTKDAEWGLYNEGTDSVFLFHNKSGKVLSSWGVKSAFYNMPLDVSSDGHWGVAGSDDGYVTLIDLTNNSVAREIKAHQSQVSAVKFTPDAKYFISAGLDGAIKQFSIYNEKSPVDIGLVNSEISNIVYEGHGNNVLYFGANTLNLFDLKMSSLHSIAKINSENVAPQDDLKDILGIVSNGIFGFDPYSHHIAKASKSSFCLVGFDNYSTLFDVSTSNVKIEKIQGIAPFCIASSGNYALFSSLDGSKILHYDLKNNKLSGSFPKVDNMNVLCISADGKKGYSSYKDNSIAIWDLTTVCRQIKNLKSKENGVILSMIISSDNNRMYVSRSGGIIEMWDIKNFKLIKSFGQQSFMNTSMQLTDKVKIADEFKQMAFSIAFSSSHLSLDDSSGLLMYALNMGTIFLYDIRNDHTKILSINPKSEIKHVEIKPGGQYAYIQYDNNAIDYFDLNNETVKSTFIPVNQSDFIEITPDNYYFATKNIDKFIGFTKDLNYYTFEQLDIKYNRPDKVLEAIGNTDTSLITSYRMAYYKRIRKLGIDTSSFTDGYSVPEADFADRDKISYQQTNGTLALHITGADSAFLLDRFNLFINGSPLYGLKGINLRNSNKHRLDTTITITLTQGKNIIETSVANVNGIESYRMPLEVHYTPETPVKEKLYFVGIGANHFADSRYNLQYSAKDIRDLAASLESKYGDNIEIDTLFDEQVTAPSVLALRRKLLRSSVNDKVIIAYSGHGLLSKDYDYYLSAWDIDFTHPEQKGLPYDALESLLDSIPARQKLLLIDACNSGEVDKDELARMRQEKKNSTAMKGLKIFIDDSAKLGTKNTFELMQNLFVNLGRNTGATVISAAAGTQYAIEKDGNGIFTRSILEYMQQHEHANVNELKQYVNQRVTELTNGMQVPTTREENLGYDWGVW